MAEKDRDKEQEYAEAFKELELDYEQETGRSYYEHGQYTRHYVEWLECKILDLQSHPQALKGKVEKKIEIIEKFAEYIAQEQRNIFADLYEDNEPRVAEFYRTAKSPNINFTDWYEQQYYCHRCEIWFSRLEEYCTKCKKDDMVST